MLKAELGDAGVEYIDRVHPVSPRWASNVAHSPFSFNPFIG
jgi:hypothetical protein